jgi:hypothetical protein
MEEDLQPRPWGLEDFRLVDPDGYYLRVTFRSRPESPLPRQGDDAVLHGPQSRAGAGRYADLPVHVLDVLVGGL